MDDLFGDIAPKASTSNPSNVPQHEEEEYESVLFVARESYVYRLPARTSTAGYKAAEWGDMEAFIWKGRCRVMEYTKGSTSRAVVRLEDSNTGELFAQCPYDKTGKPVEAVLDSSRYFALKVVDIKTGKHAYLGMGFQDRSEAFDFQVALQDWQKRQKAPTPIADDSNSSGSTSASTAPKRDFSLKAGETISVRLGGGNAAPTKKSAIRAESGGPIPLLAPPPSAAARKR